MILVLADIKEKEVTNIVSKLQQFKSDILCFIVGQFGKNQITSEYLGLIRQELPETKIKEIQYGEFKLSSFERKLFIRSSSEEFNKNVGEELNNFTVSTGQYRPFSWRKEVKDNVQLDVERIFKENHKQDCARFILKVQIENQNMRYLNAKKTKLYFQRAFIRAGFPARKKKVFFTDKFKFKEFSFGTDYLVGQLTEKLQEPTQYWVDKINESLLEYGLRAERLEIYSMAVKAGELFDYMISEVYTDFDFATAKIAAQQLKDSSEYAVKIKVPGLARGSWITQEIDARQYIQDIWVEQVGAKTVIRLISMPPVNLYTILPSMMKTSQANCYRFPVRRLDFFKKDEEFALDFFADTCEVCGESIQKNVFDEPIHSTLCARHIPVGEQVFFSSSALSEQEEQEDKELMNNGVDSGEELNTEHDVTDAMGEGDILEEQQED